MSHSRPRAPACGGAGEGEGDAIIDANAKILQQQATIERLTNLIEEHNRDMREMCGHDPMCVKCRAVGKKCPGCTRDYMIDTQDGVK